VHAYEECFTWIADTDRRRCLVEGAADALPADIHAAGSALVTELTRFVLARHGEWDGRFFEAVVFWGAP
jgi:hypothetical protein